MLRQYELVERVRAYDPDADEEMLNRAYVFSMKAHGGQLRASGDPYFSHPIEVAGILTNLRMDVETIVTAILHDTIEDTVATQDEIARLFGSNVARLVDGVTKLSQIKAQTETARAAENFRKFILAMSGDIRVLLVKLADRMHNMQTLHFLRPEKRRRIARETLDIYAPLAERIGMYEFMTQLQDLAFKELEPQAHAAITERMHQLRAGDGEIVARIVEDLRGLLAKAGLEADVVGREKQPYSVWRKMQEDRVSFEQLSDAIAFRIMVASSADCYRTLGAIHENWPLVPGRFKDYISLPKNNGYRSLHTTVLHNDHRRVEVQIRTHAMHQENELGLAAHWSYKQGQGVRAVRDQSYPWLNDLLVILENAASPEEMYEHAKLAMYQDRIFCFTPKGELIQLPKGATVIDFAYAVHTELGDTTVGGKINGRVMPLATPLRNGDQIEVLRSKGHKPEPGWEKIAITGKARSAIRRSIRQYARDELIRIGTTLYDAAICTLDVHLADTAIDEAVQRLHLASRDALFVALAQHEVTQDALLHALLPGVHGVVDYHLTSQKGGKAPAAIRGLPDGAQVRFASCCHPIPGERIIGLCSAGSVVEVHNIDCVTLAADHSHAAQWLDLSWTAYAGRGVARLHLKLYKGVTALKSLFDILDQMKIALVRIDTIALDQQFHRLSLDVELYNVAQLNSLLATLRAMRGVVSIVRARKKLGDPEDAPNSTEPNSTEVAQRDAPNDAPRKASASATANASS